MGDIALLVLASLAALTFLVFVLPELIRRLTTRSPRDVVHDFMPVRPEELTTVSRAFPLRARADLQRALDELLQGEWNVVASHGVASPYAHSGVDLSELLQPMASLCTPSYTDVDVGEDRPVRCIEGGILYLLEIDGNRLVLLVATALHLHEPSGMRVEVAVPSGEVGTDWVYDLLDDIERRIALGVCYRGKTLSLLKPGHCGGAAAGIQVHSLEDVERDAIILPELVLHTLERNVVEFARQRAALAEMGQARHKGVLLHGPPGTGKTYCIRYLTGALENHTTLLVTGEDVGLLEEYTKLARQLQPSLLVVEDVDLVARHREEMVPGQEGLLNRLLNEMDGLQPDAEIIFLLTTNRPEAIEEALCARPGRIDQAIHFPLPDRNCRERLVDLYGSEHLEEEARQEIVRRSDGGSAAFIKELVRRSLQFRLERGEGPVRSEDVDLAMEELLVVGGSLSKRLLGAEQALGFESTLQG